MKKLFLSLSLACSLGYADCFIKYNDNSTCFIVIKTLDETFPIMLNNFNEARERLVLEPTNKLNELIIKHNKLNASVYEKQKAILMLDNEVVRATKEQEFLLKQLSELKEISVKLNAILQKTQITDTNDTK